VLTLGPKVDRIASVPGNHEIVRPREDVVAEVAQKKVEVFLPPEDFDFLWDRRRRKGTPMGRQLAELVRELRDREQGDAAESVRPARAG
jgi:predicted Rdx family selenoprotein